MDFFFSIVRDRNHFEKYYIDFENLLGSSLSKEQAVAKLGMNNVPPTGTETYVYLQIVWEDKHMQYFAVFFWKGITIKLLFQQRRECRNWLTFTTTKWLICLSLDAHYPIWPILANINQHIENFIPSQEPVKFCLRKYEKIWLVDRP